MGSLLNGICLFSCWLPLPPGLPLDDRSKDLKVRASVNGRIDLSSLVKLFIHVSAYVPSLYAVSHLL